MKYLYQALDVILLLLSLWFGNLAVANWWAAGGPPTVHPEIYAFRGNISFALAILCFIGFVVLLVIIRRMKKKKEMMGAGLEI